MSIDKPSVSIILPTYNRAYIIERAIRSVLNQTYQDFEILIIDDGSTDDTEARVKPFKEQDWRIKYYRHSINKGQSAARNTGISLAQGDYIAFQDSDDEWIPYKLERQVNILFNSSPDIGMVYTGFVRIYPDRKVYTPSHSIKNKSGNIYKELLNRNFIGMPTVLIRRECLDRIGLFDESLPAREDWELFIRLSRIYKVVFIDEPLVIEYESEDSISRSKDSNISALKLIIEKHLEEFKNIPRALAEYYYRIGYYLFKKGHIREGRSYLRRAIMLRPTRSKYLWHYLLSLGSLILYKKLRKL